MLNLPDALQMRPCTDADQEFLLSLYRASRSDLLQMQAEPAFVEHLIAMQFQIQTQSYQNMFPDAEYWLIMLNGQPIGRLILDHEAETLHIVDIAFAPQERGRGHGSTLLKALQSWAANAQQGLYLRVSHSNPRAQKLYLSLDFIPRDSDAMQVHLCWEKR
jgi:ribosomal protein S18 acetylase RimI-like enzyme